jgi:hypothetical protein
MLSSVVMELRRAEAKSRCIEITGAVGEHGVLASNCTRVRDMGCESHLPGAPYWAYEAWIEEVEQ